MPVFFKLVVSTILLLLTSLVFGCGTFKKDSDNSRRTKGSASQGEGNIADRTALKLLDIDVRPFHSYSLEYRCDAYKDFLNAFVTKQLPEFSLVLGECKERLIFDTVSYTQSFQLQHGDQSWSFTVDVKDSLLHKDQQLCLVSGNSSQCGLVSVPEIERINPKFKHMWSVYEEYVTAIDGGTPQIYGIPFIDFYKKVTETYETNLVLKQGGEAYLFNMKLVPTVIDSGMAGVAVFKAVDDRIYTLGRSFDGCYNRIGGFIGCESIECLTNPENPIEFKFVGRHLVLERSTSPLSKAIENWRIGEPDEFLPVQRPDDCAI